MNVLKMLVIVVGFAGGVIYLTGKIKDKQITKEWKQGMDQMYERGVSSTTRSLKPDTIKKDTIK